MNDTVEPEIVHTELADPSIVKVTGRLCPVCPASSCCSACAV